MFMGQYQHSLDDKGRLTIPSAFRQSLGDGAYITQGFDRNLMIMSESYFTAVYARLNTMNITDPSTRLLRRLFLSSAFRVDVDKSGRILIPPQSREFLQSQTQIMLIGQGEYFEIWTMDEWALQAKQLMDIEANSKRFAMLDLSTQIQP